MLGTPSSQYCCSVMRMLLLVCSHMKELSALNSETMDQYSHTVGQEQMEQSMQLFASVKINNIIIMLVIQIFTCFKTIYLDLFIAVQK